MSVVEKALAAAEEDNRQRQQRIAEEYARQRGIIRRKLREKFGDDFPHDDLVDAEGTIVKLPGDPTLCFCIQGDHRLSVFVEGAPRKMARGVYDFASIGRAIQSQVEYLPPELDEDYNGTEAKGTE